MVTPRSHNCREHVVIRIGPTSKTFASGGKPEYFCKLCRKPLVIRLAPDQVFARMPA